MRCENKVVPRFVCLLALVPSLLLSGCGYHVAGQATHIPPGVRTLAVPVFKTNAQAYHTEVDLTQAVVQEVNVRTTYRVINSGDPVKADATLQGTVLTESVAPLTYDPTSGQTSSYLVTVTARVVLTAQDGRVLYRNDHFAFHDQYQSTQEVNAFIQEDSPAVKRIARDFARTVVSDLLRSF